MVAASGGSTNGALHLPAIAHECGIEFDLHDVAAIFRETPYIADLKPAGRYVMKDGRGRRRAALMKALSDGGYLHGGCITVTGKTIAENLADVAFNGGQDVVRPTSKPITSWGGVVGLKGTLAPEGAIVKVAGLPSLKFRGPARVFECEEDAMAAVQARDYRAGEVLVIRYEGLKGGPGMREMLGVTSAIYGQGMGEKVALSPTAGSPAPRGFCIGHVGPEAAVGGPIGLLKDGDVIDIDAERSVLDVELSETDLAARKGRLGAEAVDVHLGNLWKYAQTVGPAEKGAVTHPGGKAEVKPTYPDL